MQNSPTERLELVLVLQDHRKIIDAMEKAGQAADGLVDKATKHRQEMEKLLLTCNQVLDTMQQMKQAQNGLASGVKVPVTPVGAHSAFIPSPAATIASNGNNFARAANSVNMGGVGNTGGKTTPGKLPSIPGPFQRLANVQQAVQQFQAQGGSNEYAKDLYAALQRAQAAVDKLNPGTKTVMDDAYQVPRLRMPGRNLPYQRLERAQSVWDDFLAKGGKKDSSYGKDLQLVLKRAQEGVNKIEQSPLGDTIQQRLARAMMSSRFGLGNAQPLVGQVAGIFGINQAGLVRMIANPYVMAGLAAMAMAKSLYDLTEQSAAVGRAFAQIKVEAGTNGLGASQLQTFGISGQGARSLSERIATDPVASMFARKYGAYALPGPFGTLDTAPNMMKILSGIRHEQTPEGKMRAMRVLGMYLYAPLINMSDGMFKRLQKDSAFNQEVVPPHFEQSVADFEAAKKRAGDAWNRLWVHMTRNPLKMLTWGLSTAADAMNATTGFFHTSYDGLKVATGHQSDANIKRMQGLPTLTPPETRLATDRQMDRRLASSELEIHTHELAKNTEALIKLTRSLGGGERTTNAVPDYLTGPKGRGAQVVRSAKSGVLRLGGI